MGQTFFRRAASLLGGQACRVTILVFFSIQSLWIALSAAYPQAFDENFHYGLIKIYSRHWLPFLNGQPVDGNPYGAVAHDPSFLYHYLMSFPYRVINLVIQGQTGQVISLRLINIALFIGGLVLFAKVLRRLKLSVAAINCCLLFIVLIPVAPQLAGQINYDNLLLPVTALACLLTFRVIEELQAKRPQLQTALLLMAVCLLASIVKYQFLPVFLAIGLFLIAFLWRNSPGQWRRLIRQVAKDWRQQTTLLRLGVSALFILSFGLFAHRDIGNLITYHALVPDCSQVLNITSCSEYPVWIHDYTSHQTVVSQAVHINNNLLVYSGEWVYWLWYRLFFAISGPNITFQNFPPLPLPAAAFIIATVSGCISLLLGSRKLLRAQPNLGVSLVIVIVYLLTLFGAGFLKYRSTGVLELMNGRYLLPIILLGMAVGVQALTQLTKNRPQLRISLAIILLLMMLDGGGVFTFISRSNPNWYFNNANVRQVNAAAKTTLEPIIFDGARTFSTPKWFFN